MSRRERKPARRMGPRWGLVWGEAWRNVGCGASRALLLGAGFALLAGGLGVAQARSVVGFVGEALAFQSSGAAVRVMTLTGGIDGAQCDALASDPGVAAAGALRGGPEVGLAVMPSRRIASFEVSSGFGRLLDLARGGGAWASGVWVAEDLARALGLGPGAGSVPLAGGGAMPVDGIYAYPNDGRNPKLAYQILAPVAPVGLFDECWALVWPDSARASGLLMLPVAPLPAGLDGQRPRPETSQANTTLGIGFDGQGKFAALPLWPMTWAGGLAGLALGFVSVRLRRLELAAVLHAGWPKDALAAQIGIETGWWLVLGLAPAAVGCYWAAAQGNTADWPSAFDPAGRTLALAAVAAFLAAQLATALTRERHLFRYFKNR